MLRVRIAGPEALINRRRSHLRHQAPHTAAADIMALAPQAADHLAAAMRDMSRNAASIIRISDRQQPVLRRDRQSMVSKLDQISPRATLIDLRLSQRNRVRRPISRFRHEQLQLRLVASPPSTAQKKIVAFPRSPVLPQRDYRVADAMLRIQLRKRQIATDRFQRHLCLEFSRRSASSSSSCPPVSHVGRSLATCPKTGTTLHCDTKSIAFFGGTSATCATPSATSQPLARQSPCLLSRSLSIRTAWNGSERDRR